MESPILKRGYVVHWQTNTPISCDIVAAEAGEAFGWYCMREAYPPKYSPPHQEHLQKLEERMNTVEYMKDRLEIDGFLQSGIIFLPRIKRFP